VRASGFISPCARGRADWQPELKGKEMKSNTKQAGPEAGSKLYEVEICNVKLRPNSGQKRHQQWTGGATSEADARRQVREWLGTGSGADTFFGRTICHTAGHTPGPATRGLTATPRNHGS